MSFVITIRRSNASYFYHEELFHLQPAATKSNDILYLTSKKVSIIHEYDEFDLENFERKRENNENIE
jgi:hypothetical protein